MFFHLIIFHDANVWLKSLISVRNMHLIVLDKEDVVISLDSEIPVINIERLWRDTYFDTHQQVLAALYI
jgi:hypothetical protein